MAYEEVLDDDEYSKLIRGMNPPRVAIDNDACDSATVIRVHSVKKHGILLDVIQVLNDVNLIITKAYISSDGGWLMDVYNVTDLDGNKVSDEDTLSYIQTSIESISCFCAPHSVRRRTSVGGGVVPSKDHTSIELAGTDRPGLLSEVCAVLTDHGCNVADAQAWAHNARAAAVIHVTNGPTGLPIKDPTRLATIKELLSNVVKVDDCCDASRNANWTTVSVGTSHIERRLHQLMFDGRDYERGERGWMDEGSTRPRITVMDCFERGYTIVILKCKDRPKLLFDTVCTLTDMQYVVFHGMVDAGRTEAYQEYYIRHVDGYPVSSQAERDRIIQCLEAAIERRASEGLELEVRTEDRVGLLSDITRVFRENGLSIRRAEISTKAGKAVNSFCVTEMSGNAVEEKTIDMIRRQMGQTTLRVKQKSYESSATKRQGSNESSATTKPQGSSNGYGFGNFFKGSSFQSFGLLVRSYSWASIS